MFLDIKGTVVPRVTMQSDLSLPPFCSFSLSLSLSLFLSPSFPPTSSCDFTSLMHDCRSYSNARPCKPEMMAPTNPRYDSRRGGTLRVGEERRGTVTGRDPGTRAVKEVVVRQVMSTRRARPYPSDSL